MNFNQIANEILALREEISTQKQTVKQLEMKIDSASDVYEYNDYVKLYNTTLDEHRENVKQLKRLNKRFFGKE